jgi:hypothetical protein
MYDLTNLKLMHFHGDEEVPMEEMSESHHDAAEHDEERGVNWWRRTFRCTRCDEQVVVQAPILSRPL